MSHFLRVALRRISREKTYALVNIIGLGLGMASAVLIFLFIRYETSFDRFHPHYQQIYRIGTDLQILDHQQGYSVSSAAIAPALTADYPEITSFLRIFLPSFFLHDMIYYNQDKAFFEPYIYAVDSTYFSFFHADFIHGEPHEALQNPLSMVLTRSLAEELFGHTRVVGETIRLMEGNLMKITAVIEDPPLNTHFRFRGLMSLASMRFVPDLFVGTFGPGYSWETFESTYGSTVVWSYVKVAEGFSPDKFLSENWDEFHKRNISGLIARRNFDMFPIFQPLASIHLESRLLYEVTADREPMKLMNKDLTRFFIVVALFILLIAAINYTNMAISHFNKKRKEIAMVKVLGSRSGELFSGFFTESFITALIGIILALVLLELTIDPVNRFLNVAISLRISNDWMTPLIIFLVFLVTAVLSGLFPTLYFLYASPVRLLAGRFQEGRKTLLLKKFLMTIQFSVAVFMLAITLVVLRQFEYLQQTNLGYEVDNIAAIELRSPENKQSIALLDSILQSQPLIKKTAITNYVFTNYPIKHTAMFQTDEGATVRSFNNIQTTEDYLALMGVKVSGNMLKSSEGKLLHPGGVLVNQALVDSMGYYDGVGKRVTTQYQFLEGRQSRDRYITGVLDNFIYALVNQPIEPLLVLPLPSERARYVVVKFHPSDRQARDRVISEAWNMFDEFKPLVYFHLEDNVESFFAHNRNLGRFFSYLAWLCIIISFLGVFGITAYNMEQRSMEISIRKVMGANDLDLLRMISQNYFLLFILGSITGLLASKLLLDQWLGGFAFQTTTGFYPYLVAAMLVGLTIFLAIMIHVLRMRSLNPSSVLRQS